MLQLFIGLVFFALILVTIYHRVRIIFALPILLLLLVCLLVSHLVSLICFLIFCVPLVLILIFAVIAPWRKTCFTKYLLKLIQKKVPKISAAEREAIRSGTHGWEQQLFTGAPNWNVLCTKNLAILSAEEQLFLATQVEHVCHLLDQEKFVDHNNSDLPPSVWQYIKQQGFWGLTIPSEYGGYGFSATAHAAIITRLASRSYSLAIMVMVPNSVGPAELIQHYGTQEQKKYYLPRFAQSKEIPCFALTSNEAGSDASSITDQGNLCWEEFAGQSTLGIRLHWRKRYITLAPIATLIGLAFKLYDPEHLLGEVEDIGITLALVPASCPGVSIGQRHHPMHLAFMNGPISGNNVFIPLEWVVGGRDGCGRGWQMILARLMIGRAISLPALTNGAAQLCVVTTSAYALVRQQFRHPIGQFEGVQLKLAEIAGFAFLSKAMQQMLLHDIENGNNPTVASAIAKYHLTELNRCLVNSAMDIHAGRGVQLGARNYLADLYLAVPINITVEGANILTHSLIIFAQGMMSGHNYVAAELKALQDADSSARLQNFDRAIWPHLYHVFSVSVRVICYGITGGRCISSLKKLGYRRSQQQLTRMSAAFALLTDITLLMAGKRLKAAEALSARLGDILSHLYLASAVLRYSWQSENDVAVRELVAWCLAHCLHEIQTATNNLLMNYPSKLLGRLLKRLIFPAGNAYFPPADSLSISIAQQLLQHSPLRQRLIDNCFLGSSSAAHRVVAAMNAVLQATPLLMKLHLQMPGVLKAHGHYDLQMLDQAQALGILNEHECAQLHEMICLCKEAILVDVVQPK